MRTRVPGCRRISRRRQRRPRPGRWSCSGRCRGLEQPRVGLTGGDLDREPAVVEPKEGAVHRPELRRPDLRARPGCSPRVRAPGALGKLDRGAVRALVADHQPAAASAAVGALARRTTWPAGRRRPRSSRPPRRRRRRTSCWRRCRCTPRRARCRASRWGPRSGRCRGPRWAASSLPSAPPRLARRGLRRGLAARRRRRRTAGRRPVPGADEAVVGVPLEEPQAAMTRVSRDAEERRTEGARSRVEHRHRVAGQAGAADGG